MSIAKIRVDPDTEAELDALCAWIQTQTGIITKPAKVLRIAAAIGVGLLAANPAAWLEARRRKPDAPQLSDVELGQVIAHLLRGRADDLAEVEAELRGAGILPAVKIL